MHEISIDASPHQLRKLRKGLKVRLRKGTGFNLVVHPETYNLMSKSFSKSKGVEVALSPEELQHNAESLRPRSAPPPSREIDDEPVVPVPVGKGLRSKVQHLGSLAKSAARAKLAGALNKHLDTNFDYLNRANLGTAVANLKNANLTKIGINARRRLGKVLDADDDVEGSEAPRSRNYIRGGTLHEKSSVGLGGGMLGNLMIPAMVSQPFSANFQMQHFLPPQYQHFNSGGSDVDASGSGLGTGLYAGGASGRGMYAGGGIYA